MIPAAALVTYSSRATGPSLISSFSINAQHFVLMMFFFGLKCLNSKNIENPAKKMKLTEELVMYIISWGKSMNTNTYCKYVKFIDMACTRAVTMS